MPIKLAAQLAAWSSTTPPFRSGAMRGSWGTGCPRWFSLPSSTSFAYWPMTNPDPWCVCMIWKLQLVSNDWLFLKRGFWDGFRAWQWQGWKWTQPLKGKHRKETWDFGKPKQHGYQWCILFSQALDRLLAAYSPGVPTLSPLHHAGHDTYCCFRWHPGSKPLPGMSGAMFSLFLRCFFSRYLCIYAYMYNMRFDDILVITIVYIYTLYNYIYIPLDLYTQVYDSWWCPWLQLDFFASPCFNKASWASSAMCVGSTGCLARFYRKFLHINWGLTCFNQQIYFGIILGNQLDWSLYIYISIVCSKWCGIFLLHAHLYTSCMSCSLYTVSRGASVCMCV